MRPGEVWFEGRTASGHTVSIATDPYPTQGGDVVPIVIDAVAAFTTQVHRMRDGGTTIIDTNMGRIVVASPLRKGMPHTFNDEPLLPMEDQAMVARMEALERRVKKLERELRRERRARA